MKPSSSICAASPVFNQPSTKEFFVASSLFQYPGVILGPLISISPTSPCFTSLPFSSTIFTSVCNKGFPAEPIFLAASSPDNPIPPGLVSVIPQPCHSSTPLFCQVSIMTSAHGAPPTPAPSILEKSVVAKFGCCIINWKGAGTAKKCVIPKSGLLIISKAFPGSNSFIKTICPPLCKIGFA